MWILLLFALIMLSFLLVALVETIFMNDTALVISGLLLLILNVAFITFSIIMSINVSKQPEQSRITETFEIYSLNSGVGVEGTFTLGCGTIENNIYYVVLIKNEIGYYQKIINYERIYIVESDTETPHVEYVESYRKAPLLSKLYNFKQITKPRYIIYVPVGTIMINYEI